MLGPKRCTASLALSQGDARSTALRTANLAPWPEQTSRPFGGMLGPKSCERPAWPRRGLRPGRLGPKRCGRPTWRRHCVQLGRGGPAQKVANCKLATHGLQPGRGGPPSPKSRERQTRLRMANLAPFGVQPGRGCSVQKAANGRLPRPPVGEGMLGPKSCERQICHPLASSCGGDARPQALRTTNLPPWASSQVAHARPKTLHGKLGALSGGCSVYKVANGKFGPL